MTQVQFDKRPRQSPQGRDSKRWQALMFFDVPRYIRCYDNGGTSIDRYVVLFTRKGDLNHPYVAMSEAPFHPQGVGIHGEGGYGPIDYPTYGHLGKQIVFADLPKDCQWLVIRDYCDTWNLSHKDHPLHVWFALGGRQRIDGEPPWESPRPPKGHFDSRELYAYQQEQAELGDDALRERLLTIAMDPPAGIVETWPIRTRQLVLDYVEALHAWFASPEIQDIELAPPFPSTLKVEWAKGYKPGVPDILVDTSKGEGWPLK